jgi:hypothetical protein
LSQHDNTPRDGAAGVAVRRGDARGGLLSLVLGVVVLREESNAISRSSIVLLFGTATRALPYGVGLTCGTVASLSRRRADGQ